MQQKYLEEQIGAHRKSKKALSAKQRTAKKAGREFPEEDAEQLKHVTEQQSMVQKQLEQVVWSILVVLFHGMFFLFLLHILVLKYVGISRVNERLIPQKRNRFAVTFHCKPDVSRNVHTEITIMLKKK